MIIKVNSQIGNKCDIRCYNCLFEGRIGMKFKLDIKRIIVCFLAVFGMGFFLSFLMLCGLGTDPCSFMNKAISLRIGLSFGTWQLIINAVMLVIVLFWDRSSLGFGTIFNMVLVGYYVDFFDWLWGKIIPAHYFTDTISKWAIFLVALFLFIISAAVYINSDMGADSISNYLNDMSVALTEKFAEQSDLIPAIRENCDSAEPDRKRKSRPLINRLRMIFAEISLKMLEPDLVIMDEFQRFRDLLALGKDSEEKLLSQKFLSDTQTKVLLLSATPYKPYSTLEEISEDESSDHYHEFMQVMDFLFYDENKRKSFQTVWQGYTSALCELSSDSLTLLVARKSDAQNMLYQGICRTERFNTGIISDKGVEEIHISADDVLSYDAMQSLLDAINQKSTRALQWKTVPLDYVKSAPYLLSFMENYQLKKQIRSFCTSHPDFSIKQYAAEKYLLLRKTSVHNYRPVSANNARLDYLKKMLFKDVKDGKYGSEALLWVPASHPYYHTEGVFSQNINFSKVLVFSSWEMVPRMISIMLSYEAERLTIGTLFNSTKVHRRRGYFATDENRRYGTGRLQGDTEEVICLVSDTLAGLYHPEESMGSDLGKIQRDIREKLILKLDDLKKSCGIDENPKAGAMELIECVKLLDGDTEARPTGIPRGAADLLTQIAIGSPAICAYRMLLRDSTESRQKCETYAREIAKEAFVRLFNKAESSAILDMLYDGQGKEANAYYRVVFKYCVEGNLQAVLDEYAHILNAGGESLKNAIIESVTDTVSLPIDLLETFPDMKRVMMRSHYAVGYYNARVSDEAVVRVDRIRKAFNSPFRPFVLSTTSIGQEGLDFHSYCRKVMHWNLPSNPIDLEQREGRVNRFKCLAVRQNIAKRYRNEFSWNDIFARASKDLKGEYPDLVPYWCLPDLDGESVKIERIVPMYPFSQDKLRYDRIIKILSLYRLTLGQPRQEELISILDKKLAEGADERLFMNLSPFYHEEKADGHDSLYTSKERK